MMAFRFALVAAAVTIGTAWGAGQSSAPPTAIYIGSAACSRCHAPIVERWKRTRMANVVRDPREHPEAIISDFSRPNPLVTFTKEQIGFSATGIYGALAHWVSARRREFGIRIAQRRCFSPRSVGLPVWGRNYRDDVTHSRRWVAVR
jgi:hypothetical protein